MSVRGAGAGGRGPFSCWKRRTEAAVKRETILRLGTRQRQTSRYRSHGQLAPRIPVSAAVRSVRALLDVAG
jgi:hypothetical protein